MQTQRFQVPRDRKAPQETMALKAYRVSLALKAHRVQRGLKALPVQIALCLALLATLALKAQQDPV